MHLYSLCALFISATFVGSVLAAIGHLQQMTSFGENPTNLRMFYYKPANVQENSALIVAIHYCGGSAQAYFGYSPYANLADQKGFMVLYPESSRDTKCFDSTQSEAFLHDAGGDSFGIANAVRQAISTFNIDTERVFVTGFSSGGTCHTLLKDSMIGTRSAKFSADDERGCRRLPRSVQGRDRIRRRPIRLLR
jgi:acetylxylan esterase